MLNGLKTYAVVGVAIMAAILGFFTGHLSFLQAAQGIGLAVGLGGNRLVLQAAAILTGPYNAVSASPTLRMLVTYAGVAITILTAVVAGLTGAQDPVVTISAILGALGLNFLGLGAKKVATGEAVKPTR